MTIDFLHFVSIDFLFTIFPLFPFYLYPDYIFYLAFGIETPHIIISAGNEQSIYRYPLFHLPVTYPQDLVYSQVHHRVHLPKYCLNTGNKSGDVFGRLLPSENIKRSTLLRNRKVYSTKEIHQILFDLTQRILGPLL